MKPVLLIIKAGIALITCGGIVSLFAVQPSKKQIPPEITDGVQIETHSTLYNQAYLEIADMLDGKAELSIKRAVFLVEWAYLDGRLDYDWYCHKIDSTVLYINRFINVNKLDKYKTAKNLALYDYFTTPLSGNSHKPFTYDFKEVDETKERTKRLVSSLMQTHEGQCYSLPLYYRILAEAIGAEAYLSFAPRHSFIRYRNEDGLFPEYWVNVELTTHQIQPEFWIIEHSGINKAMIENKVYMHPLSVRETVACQLGELASGYAHKYPGDYGFLLLCIDKALEYYPPNLRILYMKGYILNSMTEKYLASNGYIFDDYAKSLDNKLHELVERIEALGWTEENEETLKRLEEEAKQITLREREKAHKKDFY